MTHKRKCPALEKLHQAAEAGMEDPLTQHYGCGDMVADIYQSRIRAHIRRCPICQANREEDYL